MGFPHFPPILTPDEVKKRPFPLLLGMALKNQVGYT